MSARKKLNNIYLTAATLMALAIGSIFGSFTVFVVSPGILIVAFLHDGSIRTQRRR